MSKNTFEQIKQVRTDQEMPAERERHGVAERFQKMILHEQEIVIGAFTEFKKEAIKILLEIIGRKAETRHLPLRVKEETEKPKEEKKIILSKKLQQIDREFGDRIVEFELLGEMSAEERERYLKVLEAAQKIGDRNRGLWNMLVSFVESSGYVSPQERKVKVLGLACGAMEEGLVLESFFGGSEFGCYNENIQVIGVDIDSKAIEHARIMNSKFDFSGEKDEWILRPNYTIFVGNATELDKHPQIPQEVDVCMIRHQQISGNEEVWIRIIQQALKRITDRGIVIITSYSDEEHEMLLKALEGLECGIINVKNPFAKPISPDEPNVSFDRNVAILRIRHIEK